jgi:hypothetical protein
MAKSASWNFLAASLIGVIGGTQGWLFMWMLVGGLCAWGGCATFSDFLHQLAGMIRYLITGN